MQLWARKIKTKVRYFVLANLSIPSASSYVWQFSGNSAYDPDYTFIGSTTNSWTTLTTLYQKYMATYSKLKVEWQPVDAAVQRIYFTGCKRSATALAIPLSLSNAIAQPDTKHSWHFNNGLSNSVKHRYESKDSTVHVLGRKLDPSLDRHLMNADPTEEWLHILQWWNVGTLTTNVQAAVYVTYWVELSDPQLASTT